MIVTLIDMIACDLCGGNIEIDKDASIEAYINFVNMDDMDVATKVDSYIGRSLVYRCTNCDQKYNYTYREIERLLRKIYTEKFLIRAAKGEIVSNLRVDYKYFIYCGKCTGFDGAGSCPPSVFESCKIKRFPYNGI